MEPPTKFGWVGHEAKGTFPGPSVPLLEADFPQAITDVDVSRNAIADIDAHTLLVQLPRLQRLNLSDNLLTSLSCVVPLGILPHLEDLDLRGNPCCPNPSAVTSRSRLLATLLAPEASKVPKVVAAAEETKAKHARFVQRAMHHKSRHSHGCSHASSSSKRKATVKSGSLDLEAPGLTPGMYKSSSAPVLMQMDAQSSVQERLYRSIHMQGSGSLIQAERAARQHLLDISGRCRLQGDARRANGRRTRGDWKPQHIRDLKRRVTGCLPRAHLYHSAVGSCYDPVSLQEESAPISGAGAGDWFPTLRMLNGSIITVQDLEEAASFADELLESNISGEHFLSESEENEGDTSKFDDLRQTEGEDYHRYLVRVRTTFLHYWNDTKAGRPRRHYCKDYERWRQEREAKQDDAGSDEDLILHDSRNPSHTAKASKTLVSPANSASTRAPTTFLSPLTQTESVLDTSLKEEDVGLESPELYSSEPKAAADKHFQMMEVDMWAAQRDTLRHLEEGGVIDDGLDEETIDEGEVVRDIGFESRSMEPKHCSKPESATRPRSASQPSRMPKFETRPKSASQPSRTTSRVFLRKVVPHENFFMEKKRDKQLHRCYAKEAAAHLPIGVRAIMHPESHMEGEAQKYASAGVRFEDDDDASSDGSNAEALSRLRALGLTKRSSGDTMANARTCELWLRQLADDYPDKLSRVSGAAEPPVNSKMPSWLYVCKIHGDPLAESSWQLRKVWLSATGRVWLGSPDADKHGNAVLFLGGCTVRDFIISQVKPGGEEAVANICGKTVYPFKIDTPGARFSRRRYFAAKELDVRSMWIRICNTLVPTD